MQMVEPQYWVIRGHGPRKSQDTSLVSNWNAVLFLSKRRLQPLPAWRNCTIFQEFTLAEPEFRRAAFGIRLFWTSTSCVCSRNKRGFYAKSGSTILPHSQGCFIVRPSCRAIGCIHKVASSVHSATSCPGGKHRYHPSTHESALHRGPVGF
jgi:hypothetical protein